MEKYFKDVDALIEKITNKKQERQRHLEQIAEKNKLVQETEDVELAEKLLTDMKNLQRDFADDKELKAQIFNLMKLAESHQRELYDRVRAIIAAADRLKTAWVDFLFVTGGKRETKH
ncbi:MAG: hypothetical protein WC373_10530 [Smithella sp.]|jgi:poly-beta-hydroxyalkanoate depolymerase